MNSEKEYRVVYCFSADAEPRHVFETVVNATSPQHAERSVKQSVWIAANHDDWRNSEQNEKRLESLQFIDIRIAPPDAEAVKREAERLKRKLGSLVNSLPKIADKTHDSRRSSK
jgi:hypothetical protein